MVGVVRPRRRAGVAAVAVGACPREPTAALILPSGPLAEVDRRGNFVSGARKPGIEPAASFHHWSSPRRVRAGPRRCRGPSGQMCLKSISTAADATSRAARFSGGSETYLNAPQGDKRCCNTFFAYLPPQKQRHKKEAPDASDLRLFPRLRTALK